MSTAPSGSVGRLEPYLFFEGRCDEAIEFYKRTLGAEVTGLMRFRECPEPDPCASANPDKVMHANVKIGEDSLMMSDGRCGDAPVFQGFSLSLPVPTAAEAERVFSRLAEGGAVLMPLAKTFFSPQFGMVTDQFGVSWMVIVPG